jgi:adenylate cyclase
MSPKSLPNNLAILLREIKYGVKHDWRKMGPWIKRAFACALVASAHSLLFNVGVGPRLEPLMLHAWFALRGARETPKSVTVLRLDEQAYAKINLLPGEKFPRKYIAEGLDRLTAAGAKMIVLDLFARRPSEDPAADTELADSLSRSPSVIGRYTEDIFNTDPNGHQIKTQLHNDPLDIFAKSAKAVITLEVRLSDGEVEEISLSNESNVFSEDYVPLLKPLRKYVSPTVQEPGGSDFINFYGGPFALPNLSFAELLGPEDQIPTQYFKDRVVFVGVATNAGVGIAAGKDTFITSISKLPMYGVEIQATIAANLLDGSWIRRFSREGETIVLALVSFAITFLVLSLNLVWGTVVAAIAACGWLAFSYLAFARLYYFAPGATLFALVIPGLLVLRWTLRGAFKAAN